MLKRINKEYNDLRTIYGEKNVELEEHDTRVGFNQQRVRLIVRPDTTNILTFSFSDDYPFKPPILMINGVNAQKCYKINNKIRLNAFMRKFGKTCLCCETLLCPHKWSPAARLPGIINEYNKNKRIKKYINSYILLLIANNKYDIMLPDEIIDIIDHYLFKTVLQQQCLP